MSGVQERLRVLIVDDSVEFTVILRRILAHALPQASITSFATSSEGIENLRSQEQPYDLLFIDYHYPTGINGGELVSLAYSEKLVSEHAVVFIMSSEPNADALRTVIAAGASGVIAKPFEREPLVRQIERALKDKRTGDQSFSL